MEPSGKGIETKIDMVTEPIFWSIVLFSNTLGAWSQFLEIFLSVSYFVFKLRLFFFCSARHSGIFSWWLNILVAVWQFIWGVWMVVDRFLGGWWQQYCSLAVLVEFLCRVRSHDFGSCSFSLWQLEVSVGGTGWWPLLGWRRMVLVIELVCSARYRASVLIFMALCFRLACYSVFCCLLSIWSIACLLPP